MLMFHSNQIIFVAVCLSLGCSSPPLELSHDDGAIAPPCDTCAVTPPLKAHDAIRVLANPTGSRGHTLIDGGSWAAHAMVRLASQIGPRGYRVDPFGGQPIGPFLSPIAPKLSNIWMGRDGLPWTSDDRPFTSFHELISKANLTSTSLGLMLDAIKRTPPLLPREPLNWIHLDGYPVTRREAHHLLFSLNHCAIDELNTIVKLSRHAKKSLTFRRPFADIKTLTDAPGFNRKILVRLHHLRHKLNCSAVAPPRFDAFDIALDTHPELSRAQWLFTPGHVDLILARVRSSSPVMPSQALSRTIQALTSKPFAHFIPQAPRRQDSPRQRREAAAEAIVEAFWRRDGRVDFEVLAPCLEKLRLRQGPWIIFEQRMIWTARGFCAGQRVKVHLDLDQFDDFVLSLEAREDNHKAPSQ